MPALVDSSVWIDYFRDGKNSGKLDSFLDDNALVINDIILAELIPFLKIKKQRKIIDLLYSIDNHFKLLQQITDLNMVD